MKQIKKEKVPFSPPYLHEGILESLKGVLDSGWITTGQKTKELEKALEAMTQANRVLCVNSATAGMELMLRWWGVGPGDEVIIPAYTYCATANVVVHCGAVPIMADIKSEDFTISPAEIERLISPRTKAVITVDLGGMPCDYEEILAILENAAPRFSPNNERQERLGRVLLMADAAHSLGSLYKNKATVKYTDVSVFSFHAVKNLTTAEGGAIALNMPHSFSADEIYQFLYMYALHGQSKDAFAKLQLNAWEYDVTEAGYKCNMPDILAVIGLAGIHDYDKVLTERKKIFEDYSSFFEQVHGFIPPIYETENKKSSYHLYLLRLKNSQRSVRDTMIQKISEAGVAVNVHYKPLPMLTFYHQAGYRMTDYPVALHCFESEITLPVFYGMTIPQQDLVMNVLKNSII